MAVNISLTSISTILDGELDVKYWYSTHVRVGAEEHNHSSEKPDLHKFFPPGAIYVEMKMYTDINVPLSSISAPPPLWEEVQEKC